MPLLAPELERVRHDVLACRRCPRLVRHRLENCGPHGGGPVPGFGDPSARVHVLGLATRAAGNPSGRSFTGNRSASFLVAALYRAGLANRPTSEHADDGLELNGAWMASAVRCPPPGNRPTAAERDACGRHLRAEWAALPRLRVVVALGGLAWEAARRCADLPPVPFAHGQEHDLPGGLTLLGSYHPSPQNTNTGLLTAAMLDDVLLRACAIATHHPEGGAR